jgi:hypothetical protein
VGITFLSAVADALERGGVVRGQSRVHASARRGTEIRRAGRLS